MAGHGSSYSFRHGKNSTSSSSISSSSSASHQRVGYGSRSASTGTPPQTPTIRVTSPVPDAVGVIDIWDPELTDEEPRPTSPNTPKSYSFRFKEEAKQHSSKKTETSRKKNFTDSGMQADPSQASPEDPGSNSAKLGEAPIEDDGLKTAGESEESSDCEEISQISAVTQVAACCQPEEPDKRWPDEAEPVADPATGVEEKKEDKDPLIRSDDEMKNNDPPTAAGSVIQENSTERRWDEMHPLDGKPIKRVQFSRSLSLVPGSSAAQSTASETLTEQRSIRGGSGRRYSSMDAGNSSVPLDIFPTSTFVFADQQPFPASGGKMLSPTPESALENAQSPQQETSDEPTIPSIQLQDPNKTEVTELSGNVVAGEDDQSQKDHDPTCDLFDRLNRLKNDEELMDLATGFVLQLLRTAQEEALRRGHVPSKVYTAMAQFLEHYRAGLEKALNEPGICNDLLAKAEQRTGVKRIYIALGVVGVLSIYLIFGYGAQLLCNAIGFIYPAYTSVKAIESERKDDDTKWLTYWVVFAFLNTIEFFSDIFLSWFPLYWLAKCVLLVWCFAPISWNGSNIIYTRIIRKQYLKHSLKLDKAMGEAANNAAKLLSQGLDITQSLVKGANKDD